LIKNFIAVLVIFDPCFFIKNAEHVSSPPALKLEYAYNLDISDTIFDSLKKDYPEFIEWFEEKCCRKGRKCWVHFREDNKIGALLIYKIENEAIPSEPPLIRKERFKICTLKVTYIGKKIGELLIKLSIDYCIKNNISEIYLTHFVEDEEDQLIELISEYGFIGTARIKHDDGRIEEIFVKDLIPPRDLLKSLKPLIVSKKYYPNFYDGIYVNKFIVPIYPQYHDKLFADFPERQPLEEESLGEFIVEGNAITKAYLSHSPIKKLGPGDILIFYKTSPQQYITSIGVVESIFPGMSDSDQILNIVAKRTVFTKKEIEEMGKPILIILFRHHFHFKNYFTLAALKEAGIIAGPPQSISQISHENYMRLKDKVGINGCYTVD